MNPTRRTVLTALGLMTAAGAGAAVTQSAAAAAGISTTDPVTGWTNMPFTFTVQKPWDRPLHEHYVLDGQGVHTLAVKDTDQPFQQGSTTDPRAEMRWHQEYSTGQHMWDADVFLTPGTDGATFAQILRLRRPADTAATDFMLNVYNTDGGTVRAWSGKVLKTNAYGHWFNVKIAHEATAGTGAVRVWFDGQPVGNLGPDGQVVPFADRGPAEARHFKNGVYHHGTGQAEVKFRNVTYWTR